jgi:hypothetical protein
MSHATEKTVTTSVDTADLRPALEKVLNHYFQRSRAITFLERRPCAYRSSFGLEQIDIMLEDGTILPLMFKDLGWQTLHEKARRVKPEFVFNAGRELDTYQVLLQGSQLGTAICYGAVQEPTQKRCWLFLEKVPGTELYQVGDFDTWRQVARWLAGMHRHFFNRADSLADHGFLLRHDSDFFRRWMHRAETFLGQETGSSMDFLRRLAERFDKVIDQFLILPVTMLHGEFYASNVLVQRGGATPRICAIDWEMAGIGPGLLDLAALTSGNWSEEAKISLAMAYYAEAGPDLVPPSPKTFLAALDCCRVLIAIQWLGCFGRRRPFAQHAHDWLREAMFRAEKLGL